MEIHRAGKRPTKQAPADNFTGVVLQDPVFVGTAPSRMRATNVHFTPGARTAWHSHPVGQVLYAVSGIGRVQLEGEEVQILHPGDTAMIPPDTRHWHGAARRRTGCSPISPCRKSATPAKAPPGSSMSATRTTARSRLR